MGFFGAQQLAEARGDLSSSAFYQRLGCKACPLNGANVVSPKMKPRGSKTPLVYFLGEAPNEDEDYEGKPFVGSDFAVVNRFVPREWREHIRYANVIRTHPGNREPETIELECCRPFQVADIEETQPKAIFGFGDVVLQWVLKQRGILKWRGRRVPVKIGKHECWFYPMLSPAEVTEKANVRRNAQELVVFEFDLRRALDEVESLPPAHVLTKEEALAGIECVDWNEPRAIDKIVSFLARAGREKDSGLDYETSHLRPYTPGSLILTAAVALPDKTLAFPIDHPEAKWSPSDRKRVHDAFQAYLRAPVRKIAHNEAFEMEWSAVKYKRDIIRAAPWGCTMTQAAILDERIGGKPDQEKVSRDTSCLGLGFVTLNRLGLNIKTLSFVDTKNMVKEKLADILPYNGLDAKECLEIYFDQREDLKAQNLWSMYNKHKRRIPTVVLTQIKGIPNDFDQAKRQKKKLTKLLDDATAVIESDSYVKEFKNRYRKPFNPGSDSDCVKLIRDIVGSKAGNQANGRYKVTKEVLAKVKQPIGKKILDWRQPGKLLSTYTWTPGHPFVYSDGKLHPILNTLLTVTGRLSSEDPNEQNIPKRTELGKEVRKQIKAPPGFVLFSVDYAQIEARCIAMLSKDPVYVKMLWENYDVHLDWAERIAARYPRVLDQFKGDKPIKELRQKVKGGWVFALFFGAQLSTAERQVGVPEGTLSREYDKFWETFSGVLDWQNGLKDFYREHGYVENLFGRRRRAPISPNQLINAPVQSLMGEIVMDGMNNLSETGDWHLQPIMQVHDDLTSLFPIDQLPYYMDRKLDILLTQKYDFLNVPLVVEASYGPDLYHMEEIDSFSSHDWKRAHGI